MLTYDIIRGACCRMNSRLAACVLVSCGAVALLGTGRHRAPCGSCAAADDDRGRRRLGNLFWRPGSREEVDLPVIAGAPAAPALAGYDPATEGDVAVDFFLLSGQSNAVSQRSAILTHAPCRPAHFQPGVVPR